MHGSDDQKLDALFRAYHDACVVPEASANFMPNLWARIESRQRFTFSFRRMANALTTAAVALVSRSGSLHVDPAIQFGGLQPNLRGGSGRIQRTGFADLVNPGQL